MKTAFSLCRLGLINCQAQINVTFFLTDAPQIDRSQQFAKAAARNMETATVLCKAEGAPAVAFKWFRVRNEIEKLYDNRVSFEKEVMKS